MFGLPTRRSIGHCPNCEAEFDATSNALALSTVKVCELCGARMRVTVRLGKLTSVTRAPGFEGLDPKDMTRLDGLREANEKTADEKKRRHHGDNWKLAHDDWIEEQYKWLALHKND